MSAEFLRGGRVQIKKIRPSDADAEVLVELPFVCFCWGWETPTNARWTKTKTGAKTPTDGSQRIQNTLTNTTGTRTIGYLD